MLEEFEEAHLVNHKGTWCVFGVCFCQEGVCSSCWIPIEGHVDKEAVLREANQILFKAEKAKT
jgi:hypothetical protein